MAASSEGSDDDDDDDGWVSDEYDDDNDGLYNGGSLPKCENIFAKSSSDDDRRARHLPGSAAALENKSKTRAVGRQS